MKDVLMQSVDSHDLNAYPMAELGWPEVARGLNRILGGYLLMIFAIVGGVGILVVASVGGEFSASLKMKKNTRELVALLGAGLMIILILVSYYYIIAGKWRCLLNSPERAGARWLIFASMTCLIMGPVLNRMTAMLYVPVKAEKKEHRAAAGDWREQFDREDMKQEMMTVYGCLSMVSSVIGLLHGVFFLLFLRAVARCFNDRTRIIMVDLYIGFTVLLFGGTLFLFFGPKSVVQLFVVMGLAGGLLISLVWYLVLIFSVRLLISASNSNQRSPIPVVNEYAATGLSTGGLFHGNIV